MKRLVSLLSFLVLLMSLSLAQEDSAVFVELDSGLNDSTAVKKVDTTLPKLHSDSTDTVGVKTHDQTNKAERSSTNSPNVFIENKIDPSVAKNNSDIPNLEEIISWSKIIWSILLLIITYLLIQFIVLVINRLAEKSTNYRIGLKSIAPFVRIFGWAFTLFVIIHGIFRPPMETLVALVASVGVAVGFASQDILKNIFGGIMILFDRPFQVGDKIEIGNYYGEVKSIGLRSTRIQTKDDSLVSVPNAEAVNKSVSNANTGESNCQVVAEIYLPIDIDTNVARQIATEAAQVSRYIYLNKPITVLFYNEVKERRSYLKMRLKAYVSDIRYEFTFQSDMTEIVLHEFLQQGLIKKEDLM